MRKAILCMMFTAAGLVCATAPAWADYTMGHVGTSTNVYFQAWCQDSSKPANGLWSFVQGNKIWLASVLCIASGSSRAHGTGDAGYAGVPPGGTQANSTCATNYRLNGIAGYHDSTGVNDLWPRCLHAATGYEYEAYWQPMSWGSGNYASVRCAGQDLVVGLTGSEIPRLLRLGVICRTF